MVARYLFLYFLSKLLALQFKNTPLQQSMSMGFFVILFVRSVSVDFVHAYMIFYTSLLISLIYRIKNTFFSIDVLVVEIINYASSLINLHCMKIP